MGFEPMTSCLLDKRSNQLRILLKTVAYNNQEKKLNFIVVRKQRS